MRYGKWKLYTTSTLLLLLFVNPPEKHSRAHKTKEVNYYGQICRSSHLSIEIRRSFIDGFSPWTGNCAMRTMRMGVWMLLWTALLYIVGQFRFTFGESDLVWVCTRRLVRAPAVLQYHYSGSFMRVTLAPEYKIDLRSPSQPNRSKSI